MPKIRRKRKCSTYEMKFVTGIKKSGNFNVKKVFASTSDSSVLKSNSSTSLRTEPDNNESLLHPDSDHLQMYQVDAAGLIHSIAIKCTLYDYNQIKH